MDPTISQEYLKSCLTYNEETGDFTWKERPTSHFPTWKSGMQWNGRFAGNKAGGITKQGYARICLDRARIQSHRLAWLYVYGKWPTNQIDHINGNRKDNRIANLREATESENKMNTALRSNNSSGIKGVSWCKTWKRWKAYCSKSGKVYNAGSFKTKDLAMSAAIRLRDRLHGEFTNHG